MRRAWRAPRGEGVEGTMAVRIRARSGRRLAALAAAVAASLVLGVGVAGAADAPTDPMTFEEIFLQLQDTPVYKEACTRTCHGNIAKTKNYSSAIIFSHGYHQLPPCSSCHPRFPHRADTTIERPSMKKCFDCHGVRHGPMGIIATDACEDCHVTPKERLRPAFHTFGWAGKEHVAPANKEFNTRCAMCHKPASCTECHEDEGIRWSPASWAYDSSNGCLACHGDEGLTKQSASGLKSFSVKGLEASAHERLTCQQCHIDYKYDDGPNPSALWTANASAACARCHRTAEGGKWAQVVADYDRSQHARAVRDGNFDSATCSSCHGGHFIFRLDTDLAKQRMHLSAYRVCARCHDEEYGTYDDYYHGKAYKAGNPDAPACWDCHGAHDIRPASDPGSLVAAKNVDKTCGQEGCHTGTDERFGATAARLIHEKVKEQKQNPLYRLVARLRGE